MKRIRTTTAVLTILTAALCGGCSDADREKIAEDGERAAQAVEERAKADWAAAKETFDEQKAALWEASAPVREKAEEWGEAASAKAVEWSEAAAEAVEDWAARRENAANEKTEKSELPEASQEND